MRHKIPLTQVELDTMKCDCGNCDAQMWVHSRCHPGQGVEAVYQAITKQIIFQCHVCHTEIVRVLVAKTLV